MPESAIDTQAFRAALLAERETLTASSESTAGNRMPAALDQQRVGRLARMDAIQVRAMADAEEGRRQVRLRLIDAALARLDAREYGFCVTCGADIPGKRLEADPAAAQCVGCAE